MSTQEKQNNSKDGEKTRKSKLLLKSFTILKEMKETELLNYIESLHNILKKNEKKFKKYKEQIKKLVKKVECSDQSKNGQREVSNKGFQTEGAETDIVKSDNKEENASKNLVDEIRQAAEQAQNLNGFVYEPQSGLYYDRKTGYYYNAEYGLYYDGNTGCYYKYNQENNEFEFHSQVATTAATTVTAAPKTTERTTKTSDDDIFDNYTTIADDGNEEWGVITEGQLRKLKREKKRVLSEQDIENELAQKCKRKRKHKHRPQTQKRQQLKHHKYVTPQTDSDGADAQNDHTINDKTIAKDMEEGEIDTSSNSDSNNDRSLDDSSCCSSTMADNEEMGVNIYNKGSHFQDIAKKYPPSLRIIILESQLEDLKVGSLSLITYKGGTLGREGEHDVIIPDVNVSKFHLKFIYDRKGYIYKCIDLGSRNGTLLNGIRMSVSKVESDPYDLVHGSILQIGQTKLLCHVHEGNSTCGQCEPGLLIEVAGKNSANCVTLTRKEQLKKIQKKYGLENEKFIEKTQHASNSNYNDRAATRRSKVGSSTDTEKTQTACVNTAISSENKGFKMLSKLGWSKGEALGKTTSSSGLLEPLNVSCNAGKKGLGCEESIIGAPILSFPDKTKLVNLKKTQERYQKANIFQDSSNESN